MATVRQTNSTLTTIEFDEDGNESYFIDGKQVQRDEYVQSGADNVELTEGELTAQYQAELKSNGWTDEQIEEYQGYEDDDEFDPNDPDNLVVDPVGSGPITQGELDLRQDEERFDEELERRTAEGQSIADKENDWRVRLHLAPSADYLYASKDPGILAPLMETNGLIFPYTPQIAIQYNADYENYDLVHSNYRGYFYKGSQVQNILVTATFTANDAQEANYMLAAMHFLRSATKMFYGQDIERGMPPPVVFLTGLGEYQFDGHPCAVTMMNYNLPNDVDYISCGKPSGVKPLPTPRDNLSPSIPSTRLEAANLEKGAREEVVERAETDTYLKATYVPTKIDFNFTMIPIQTRDQVSKEFSLKDYASGKLLKKGFW